ncbi:hypothetical protein [Spiroplasma endosymbiont of Agriotes lineatus]|uniref:hypothetical protein n=1 Tax=Spiroplasma endosymbiont of Agriotes lineatus TaxID=3077930 RepID=UPI0030CF357B
MGNELLKKSIRLAKKTLTKTIKQTNNPEVIQDGLYILNVVTKHSIFMQTLGLLIVNEKLSPKLFIRHLISCKAVVCSQIYLFDLEIKKIKNLKVINEFFQNLAISSAIKSPIELQLQDIYNSKIKNIDELKGLGVVRNEKFYLLAHLIGNSFESIAIFNHKKNNKTYYNFGFYLALYFLLHRETLARKAKIPSLLDQLPTQNLLIIKLNIMEKYINAIATIYPLELNEFIILNNKSINKMKNLS